jgi:hypothetical protein
LKIKYPLTKRPEFNLEQLDSELKEITKKLLITQSIDEYFKEID